MPTYSTQCRKCQAVATKKLSFGEYDAIKEGTLHLSCTCGGSYILLFSPGDVSFVLKDGISGGWISKAGKENSYRVQRRQVMAKRERDHVRPHTLQPNFQGQIMDSWKEARQAAYQSTYENVKSELGGVTAAKAATATAKTYDLFVSKEP